MNRNLQDDIAVLKSIIKQGTNEPGNYVVKDALENY